VLLDGVALGASYKTAYTPAVDAVDEITISKNSVDAENGHSLGGVISLNMKAGTNARHGSAYLYSRDPSLNSIGDPTIVPRVRPGHQGSARQRTEDGRLQLSAVRSGRTRSSASHRSSGGTTSGPLSIVRTVPTELERRGDFSQSLLNGRVRNIYNPFASTLDAAGRVVRPTFANNTIPASLIDPVAVKMLAAIPLPNVPGNVDNLQGTVTDAADYWNLSQRFDVNITNNWKVFARYGQFKANLYQQNPTDAGFYPLSGSNRYGLSIAGDSVWVMSNKTTLNVRGSFYNMTDEFYNPSLLLGDTGLKNYWSRSWYSSLYNSGLRLLSRAGRDDRTGTNTNNRPRTPGARVVPASGRLDGVRPHESLRGSPRDEVGAARFAPITARRRASSRSIWFSTRRSRRTAPTAPTSSARAISGRRSCWCARQPDVGAAGAAAESRPARLRLVLPGRLHLERSADAEHRPALGVRTRTDDPQRRLSQQIDLTQPIPEMQATPPAIPDQARQLMASKGYGYSFNGAWMFASDSEPARVAQHAVELPAAIRVNYKTSESSVLRFAYARYLMPTSNVRDTLGDFVEQYAGYAQTTNTLGPCQRCPAADACGSVPLCGQPGHRAYGQAYGRYTNLGGAANLDEYQLRPQKNDRLNASYQKEVWRGTSSN
jgi:hypothetical protein